MGREKRQVLISQTTEEGPKETPFILWWWWWWHSVKRSQQMAGHNELAGG